MSYTHRWITRRFIVLRPNLGVYAQIWGRACLWVALGHLQFYSAWQPLPLAFALLFVLSRLLHAQDSSLFLMLTDVKTQFRKEVDTWICNHDWSLLEFCRCDVSFCKNLSLQMLCRYTLETIDWFKFKFLIIFRRSRLCHTNDTIYVALMDEYRQILFYRNFCWVKSGYFLKLPKYLI